MNRLTVDKASSIISCFKNKRILVIGDLMLDEFIWGSVYRISPEAPVPVVEAKRRSYMPGGAANVARNLRDLGVNVALVGGIGNDHIGAQIIDILEKKSIETNGIIRFKDRPTTLKTRVIGQHQQIVRIDWEEVQEIEAEYVDGIEAYVRKNLDSIDGIIFEDYGKGILTQELLSRVLNAVKNTHIITALDPKKGHRLNLEGVYIVTPNHAEACDAYGKPESSGIERLPEIGNGLINMWGVHSVLVTLGEHGMCLFEKGQQSYTISTVAREVFDVSGAGDTVIASLTAAIVAGATLPEAADFSNYAAGVVVGKMGTASVKPDELLNAIRTHQKDNGIEG
ncbi:MAG: D-glycero-beta-D-manno-heptose-7-phosphate kinase [Candidatus Auribacterota bacterium]